MPQITKAEWLRVSFIRRFPREYAMKTDKLIAAFITELAFFAYELSCLDRVWNVLFPDPKGRWHHLHVNQYKNTYYITNIDGDCGSLEYEPWKVLRVSDLTWRSNRFGAEYDEQPGFEWDSIIAAAHHWLGVVRRDWIKANKRVQIEYPLNRRYGLVSNAVVRASLPEVYRLDKALGRANVRKMVELVEKGFFMKSDNTEVSAMTASDYFHYCKIAYLAGQRKDDNVNPSLSGREMYVRYADGRHEGLLDIDPDSAQEFADWIDRVHPKFSAGGHPWEIKRGGNTTHIDLSVSRPSPYRKEGFKPELRGECIGRMVETMRMFLAIHDAKLPISIANPEGVRKRLLAQDNIGIIPSHNSLHRANQHFREEDDVFDVIHYDDFGRFKRRIMPFITWEPLPLLTPGR
jgi:hypothetical protein